MYGDYKVLPIAPRVFKVFSWAGLSLGIISALIIFSGASTPETPRWMGFVTLIVGTLYCFLFMVVSEGINLLLNIDSRIK